MTSEPGLVNVANVLTMVRILLVPVFVACMLAASRGGKLKTLLQVIATCLYVLPESLRPPGAVCGLVMAAAVVVTVVTGVDYVQQAMRLRRSEPAPGG